jgi:hypothetical protein
MADSGRHGNGGFGAAPGHDPHMLYTVSAVQILCLVDGVDELDRRREGGKELVGKCEYNFHSPFLLTPLPGCGKELSMGSRRSRISKAWI